MPTRFRPAKDPSPFRRIAASMWGRPTDPSIYGFVDIDVSETLPFVSAERVRTGRRVTLTHVVARAVALAFADNPDLNAKVRLGGRVEERQTVDVVISVMRDGGRDLSAARVDAADQLDLEGLVDAVTRQVSRSRNGEDEDYERSRGTLSALPWWLVRPALWLTDVVSNELNLHLPKLGMPRDPFGTAVVTNVGRFGIDTAFAPFVPLGRCPMLMLVPEVKERAVVVDGRVEARPILRLCATFDHRIIDGAAAGRLARRIIAEVQHPTTAARLAA